MSLEHSDVFDVTLDDMVERARDLALAPTQEAFDELWALSMERETTARLDDLGMTLEELDALGQPRTALGRLWERVEDWWWSVRNRSDAPEAAFWPLAAPLLGTTRPLQDVPGDYDEIYEAIGHAKAAIARAVQDTGRWTQAAAEEFVDAPWVWHGDDATLVLVILGEDPKIMGHDLRLARLHGQPSPDEFAKMLGDGDGF